MSFGASAFHDPEADGQALPSVPPGFEVQLFAREPLVRQPCSLTFDDRGRLLIGMGPQYRNPKPETPGDAVVLVLDDDGDGRADRTRVFAQGFNAIQGLAWHGRDLWIANAPDLTVVRDLDGDDVADEYVRVYTDLGNLEHGLHGLQWAPDGKLYMSKGNSKGLTQPGRIAPRAFRELWGVTAPPGTPDLPPAETFRKDEYRHAYHDPSDDWGLEGGVLRCDDEGRNLEIVARGFRNPWDIAFDSSFDWLGTDNDQTGGDRVFSVLPGSHFGWNHPWNAQWADDPEGPASPISGPLFEGSGTGVTFCDSSRFPASHRGVFFVNDWLSKTTYLWRPSWDGALLRPAQGTWEPFVRGGRALFRPTDLELGPDGALWILGWSRGYGAEWDQGELTNEGRILRVVWKEAPAPAQQPPKRQRPREAWSVDELIEDFDGPIAVWRTEAQDALLRRGPAIRSALRDRLRQGSASVARETWTAWTLGRLPPGPESEEVSSWFESWAGGEESPSLNLRLQSVRILAHRARVASNTERVARLGLVLVRLLESSEPRLRRAAVEGLSEIRDGTAAPLLARRLAVETDRAVTYLTWQALRRLAGPDALRTMLTDSQPRVRRGALLALLEDHRLTAAEVEPLARDDAEEVRSVATRWLQITATGKDVRVVRGRPLTAGSDEVKEAMPIRREPRPSMIRGLRARTGSPYRSLPGGLVAGEAPYADRDYRLRTVPAPLQGLELIQTANNDDGARGEGFLEFESLFPVRVWVGLDARSAHVPGWLTREYQRTPHRIEADHWTFQVYSREVPTGPVRLGGNTDDGQAGGKGMYLVAVELLPRPGPEQAVTLEKALALVPGARAERGAVLFHDPVGPGCHRCHRVEGHGNALGPDLNGVGLRAEPRHIAQSMVDPNAVITEGFHSHVVETGDGELSGILVEESGLSVTLGLATGERRVVPRKEIRTHRTTSFSAMPAYAAALTAQDIADLTAYLGTRREAATPAATAAPASAIVGPPPAVHATASRSPTGETPARPDPAAGFRVERQDDRLVITHAGRPVAHYVFRDERILRPYLAHLHAPDGTRVSRQHPPVPGVDATDHDTMHPGVWLGFGDLAGEDFWRNRGTIRHQTLALNAEPTPRDGTLTFSTSNTVVRRTGETLATLEYRFRFRALPGSYRIDWEAEFVPASEGFAFGDQEEMGLGARVATPLTEKNGGRILSSSGERSAARTWGQPYDWCDYAGRIGDRWVGITLMADPANFRRSWWHNRDYGVFVANPFGREAMKQGARSSVAVARGEAFRLRFGISLHASATEADHRPEAEFRAFVSDRPDDRRSPPDRRPR